MSGNAVEYISPSRAGLVTPWTLFTTSRDVIGQEIAGLQGANSAGSNFTANLIIYVPFILVRPTIVSQFFWVNGTTQAGNADVGIYDEAGTSKLGSTGSTLASGSGVIQVVDIANFTLPGGARYWLAFGADNTGQYFRNASTVNAQTLIGIKQQVGGWSSGLPTSATFADASVAYLPYFGFTGSSVI